MALTMNRAMPTCLLALLLVMSTAVLPCHATGRDVGAEKWAKYCVGFPSCEHAAPWAVKNCKEACKFLGYDPNKGYCQSDYGGICCCLK